MTSDCLFYLKQPCCIWPLDPTKSEAVSLTQREGFLGMKIETWYFSVKVPSIIKNGWISLRTMNVLSEFLFVKYLHVVFRFSESINLSDLNFLWKFLHERHLLDICTCFSLFLSPCFVIFSSAWLLHLCLPLTWKQLVSLMNSPLKYSVWITGKEIFHFCSFGLIFQDTDTDRTQDTDTSFVLVEHSCKFRLAEDIWERNVLGDFSVGSVSRRFQQEIVSRNLLQWTDINFTQLLHEKKPKLRLVKNICLS